MTTPHNTPDAILEITLQANGQLNDEAHAPQVRAPLFSDPQSRNGQGALIQISGELPWRVGQTRQAHAWFLTPALAFAQFPAGAPFWSFGMEGRIVEWIGVDAAVPAE